MRGNHKHGDASTKGNAVEYTAWKGIIRRCTNPRAHDYPRYGGRGITVTDEWRGDGGYVRFLAHVGRKPSADHSIDRVDNLRGYEPGNVRWATREQQSRNRRSTVLVTIAGRSQCLKDWCQELGLSYVNVRARVSRGRDPLAALGVEAA